MSLWNAGAGGFTRSVVLSMGGTGVEMRLGRYVGSFNPQINLPWAQLTQ